MFHSEEYMHQLIDNLMNSFGDRLIYVGLQGSYMRGEATEISDIDPMVVIDGLCVSDLDLYKQIITEMDQPEKSCGFICGKQELLRWNPLEICHLLHTTQDFFGCLSELVPEYADVDVRNFVKLSVNNLYHEITHRYVHATPEKNQLKIVGSYKSVFFILQNVYYLETGTFVATKRDLCRCLSGLDAEVLATAMTLMNGTAFDFEVVFALLHSWCQNMLQRLTLLLRRRQLL